MPTPWGLNILVVPDKSYPVQHALLENIFCRELPRRGHRVLWLLSSFEVNCFGERRTWDGTEVYLTPLRRGEDRPTHLLNLLYLKPRGKAEVFKIVREREVHVVQVRNDVQAALTSLLACRRAGIPFVYYLAFPIEEAAAESARRGWTRSRYASRIYAQIALPLRNWITRRADFVFTMSDYWRKSLIRNLGIPTERVKALPFGFDTSIHPDQVNGVGIRHQFGLDGYPVIFYMGTIGPPRDVTILADVMALVVEEVPEVRLLILPKQSDQRFIPDLECTFAERGVRQSVVFAPSVPQERTPLYIAAADVGLSPIEPIPVYNVSSPAKFVEMLGMGCPVVASDTPEQKDVLNQWGAGLSVPYDAKAFAQAIIYLLRNPAEAKVMGKQGRRFVETERSFAGLAAMVEETYLTLTGAGQEAAL